MGVEGHDSYFREAEQDTCMLVCKVSIAARYSTVLDKSTSEIQ